MDVLEALLLGLLQGLTEYLPISSSGHLAIGAHFFGVNGEESLGFTILVHVATVLSTLVVLRREICEILRGLWPLRWNEEWRYATCIVVSMVPVGIVGLCFKDQVEAVFGSGLTVVGSMLLVTAALLTFSYFARPRADGEIGLKDAFVIGLAQAAAVMPGLSRSGSTIATGLLLGCSKDKLAQFSFLMVIPPILGEALLDALKLFGAEAEATAPSAVPPLALLVGFVAAFVAGCAACKAMIALVRRGKLIWFAIYCALLGLALLFAQI